MSKSLIADQRTRFGLEQLLEFFKMEAVQLVALGCVGIRTPSQSLQVA